MGQIPNNPDRLLPRLEAAEALTEAGYPISAATLATKATRGGGPAYVKFGARVLYRWGETLSWAQNRTSLAHSTTAEHRSAVTK